MYIESRQDNADKYELWPTASYMNRQFPLHGLAGCSHSLRIYMASISIRAGSHSCRHFTHECVVLPVANGFQRHELDEGGLSGSHCVVGVKKGNKCSICDKS